MERSILSSTLAKLDLPIEDGKFERVEHALDSVCNTLEACYNDQYKAVISNQEERKTDVINLKNSLKEEIRLKIKEIATSDDYNKREILTPFISNYITSKIKKIKRDEENYTEIERYSKSMLCADLREMLMNIKGLYNFKKQDIDSMSEDVSSKTFYRMQPGYPLDSKDIYPDVAKDDNFKGGSERYDGDGR